MADFESATTDLLVGSDWTVTTRTIYGAVALCPALIALWALVAFGVDDPQGILDTGVGVVTILVALVSAANGYLGGGLIASLALGMSPPTAFGILSLIGDMIENSSSETPLWGLVAVFLAYFGAIAVVAFAVGTTARWAVGYVG